MARRARLRPRPLRPGGRIGVCAPAGPVVPERLDHGVARLEAAGYEVVLGRAVKVRSGYLAGSDLERLTDLVQLLEDPAIDAIFLARGGYGTPRLFGALDPELCARARKLVVGYSDGTALSLFLWRRAGLVSLHGPMLERDDLDEGACARLLALAAGGSVAPLAGAALRGGRAQGRLIGGNLKMILTSLGTPWEVDCRGAILFFEEVGEQPYAIDRGLVQLRDAGKLGQLRGVAIGKLVNCRSERYPERSAEDVVRELLAEEVNGPIVMDLPFGHVADNRALAVGIRARLDGDSATLALLEAAVEEAD